MSSQFVTTPCSIGYLKVKTPLLAKASSPMKQSLASVPAIADHLGLPIMEGKEVAGKSSPARPALHIPDPLSITIAFIYYSTIYLLLLLNYNNNYSEFCILKI